MFERVSWYKPSVEDQRINLSNNVCYDLPHQDKVNDLLKLNHKGYNQYPQESKIYEHLSDYYGVPAQNMLLVWVWGNLSLGSLTFSGTKSFLLSLLPWQMATGFCEVNCIEYTEGVDLNADILYIANPNGLNGSVVDRDILESFFDAFEYVIVDESYEDFCRPTCSVIDRAITRDNVLVCKTFSKSLALPGLRFGYCFGHPDVIFRLQQLRPSGVVNSVVESVGFELLCLIQEHTNRMVETRDYIESKYDCVPSNANYVLLKNEEPFLKHFRYKIINGLHRLSLTDPNTFKVYESFSDVH